MQAITLIRVVAAGALATTCAAAYLGMETAPPEQAALQAQPTVAPVVDLGRIFTQ
ncbi:MAG: hypothetical protein ABW202_05615 [Duganella sp.]